MIFELLYRSNGLSEELWKINFPFTGFFFLSFFLSFFFLRKIWSESRGNYVELGREVPPPPPPPPN